MVRINFTHPLVLFISCASLCSCLVLGANGSGIVKVLFFSYVFSGWYCSNSHPVGSLSVLCKSSNIHALRFQLYNKHHNIASRL